MQTHNGLFKTKYRENWERIVVEEEVCCVRSRMAQVILRGMGVDYVRVRNEEAKEVVFPRWYLKKLALLLP